MIVVRENLKNVKPYKSGGHPSGSISKMSSNENPFGPSNKVLKAIKKVSKSEIYRYPDSFHTELRKQIGKTENIHPEWIFVGNGSEETLFVVMDSIVEKDDEVIIFENSFSLYKIYTQTRGGKPVEIKRTDDFKQNLKNIPKVITPKTKMVVLCNPDNPTGSYITHKELSELMESLPKNIGMLIDEAYIHYSTARDIANSKELLKKDERIIISRTFSKAYGLASLRIGFVMANPELIEVFYRNRLPFNVGHIQQKAALEAMKDQRHLKKVIKKTIKGREFLKSEMENLGFKVYPSQTNFLMIKNPFDAEDLKEFLLKKKILIRELRSFGFPEGFYRITVGTMKQNKKLIKAMKNYILEVKKDKTNTL